MGLPTFNNFSLNDSNFIAERIYFKSYASRALPRANVNRREGIKLLGNEYGEKQIVIEGTLIASSAANLQSLLDSLKTSLTKEEGNLVIETNRTFKASVDTLDIPDEHYNQSTAPFKVTFIASNPFAEGTQQTAVSDVPSGIYSFSGMVTITGSIFARPTIIYTPPSNTGETFIKRLDLYHVATGQTITISGFGSGTSLNYPNAVTINLDTFASLEGTSPINNSGSFPKFDVGDNNYVLSTSGRAFPGGIISVVYSPRYL